MNGSLKYVALIAISITIVSAMSIMYLLVWEHGVDTRGDSPSYLVRAINFYNGHGLTIPSYSFETDQITWQYDGRMELLSVVFAGLMALGISAYNAPSVVSLLFWLFFLVGVGFISYRLGKSIITTCLTILFAAITWSYWKIFQTSMSEVLFLPLLVWIVGLLTGLQQQDRNVRRNLWPIAFLLSLLMLTRFTGVFIYVVIIMWWGLGRFCSNKTRQGVREVLILATAAIPMIPILLYKSLYIANVASSPKVDHTFLVGLVAVARSCLQFLVPAVHHGSSLTIFQGKDPLFFYLIPVYLGLSGVITYYLWRLRTDLIHNWLLTRSPIVWLLGMYLGLYVTLQPFMGFSPMDYRDSTTLLALGVPWLIYVIHKAGLPNRWLLVHFIFNVALIVIPFFFISTPNWISIRPPHIQDLSGQTEQVEALKASLVPEWLIVEAPRTRTLIHHHQDLIEYLKPYEGDVIIVKQTWSTTVPFHPDPQNLGIPYEYTAQLQPDGVPCNSPRDAVVVFFKWGGYIQNIDEARAIWEERCPTTEKTVLQNSTVYKLNKLLN